MNILQPKVSFHTQTRYIIAKRFYSLSELNGFLLALAFFSVHYPFPNAKKALILMQEVFSASSDSRVLHWEKNVKFHQELKDSTMDESWDSLVDSMLFDSNSMLIPSGFSRSHCTGSTSNSFFLLLTIVNSN